MDVDFSVGLSGFALVAGFPVLLLLFVLFLGRLEAWMLMPDERAMRVTKLLEQVEEAEELERAVALMMADVTPATERRTSSPVARRHALRIARRRRRAAAQREVVRGRI